MIRLLVAPDSFDVTPALPLSLTVTVINEGSAEEMATLRLVGLDPNWVAGLDAPEVSVPAGDRVDVPITVTLPAGFPAGAQLIGVEASVPGAKRPSLASLQLVVASVDGVSIGLSPAAFRGGRRGKFRINLINRGSEPISLHLSGRPAGPPVAEGKRGELEFKFKPDEVTLRPGERARARGIVSGKRPTIGALRTRPMTVVAQGKSAPIHADGRFSQRPLLSRKILRVFAIFVVLSMWAGALVTAARFSQDRRTETAADASAESDAGEDGAAPGADGEDGEGGEGGEDAQPGDPGEDGLPTGATISGQVEGLTDRANVNVDLRPVTLADALPADDGEAEIELISATKDGRTGKLSAQTLGIEPIGPVSPTMSTTTDGEGFWAFAGLQSPANYELTFSKAGFGVRTYVVSVDEENTNIPLAVTLAAGDGELSGTVSSADGPLGGATVTVTDGTVTYTTTTPTAGIVGRWSVGGLATPGTYLVTAERRGFGTETTQVTLGGSESRDGVNQTLIAGVGSISGTISGGGAGLGGITVTAANEEVSRSVTTLTDDPVGSFTLPQLPIPGSYTLTVSGTGWVPQTQMIQLTDNTDGVDFELLGTTASISGVVEGPDGELPAVGVTVSQDDPLVKTLTAIDPEGTYEISGLVPGTYTVTFERFGYRTQSTIVELVAGDRKQVDIELEKTTQAELAGSATVRGIVRDGTTGAPINGVGVLLGAVAATSDANGSFLLEKLPAGTDEIVLTSAQHQQTKRVVRLGVAADVTVDVTMLPLGGLQGQVTDLTATPIAGVTVSVAAQSGTAAVTVPSVTTDANGEYLIERAFPTGAYTATFSKAGFGTQTREFEATAGSNAVADIQLVELGTIAGSIQEPSTGVSGGFSPVANATITITRTDTTPTAIIFGPVVDADGTFNVTGLQPGDYLVSAFASGTSTFTKTIDDLKLREVRDGGLVLVPGASDVSGLIYYLDASNNRVPIGGASIETRVVTGFATLPVFPFINPILTTKTATSNATTATDPGKYVITGAVAGSVANYTITASGFVTRTVSITSSTNADEGDVTLTPTPRTVTGQAILNGAATGTVTATLTGSGLVSSKTTTFAATDAIGTTATYTFTDLQPGTYTVTFTLTDFHNATKTFTIDPGPSATAIPIPNTPSVPTLIKKSAIHVDVRENATTGTQLTDAIVTLSIPADPSFTQRVGTADSTTGFYEFDDLQAATYRLSISKDTYQTVTEDITLAVGDLRTVAPGTGTLVRALPKFTTALIHLKSNDNGTQTALTGAVVTVAPKAGGAVLSLTEVSGTPGDYQLVGLTTAMYTFTASKALHESKSVDFQATVGSNLTQTIVLDMYSDLTITVYSDPTNTGGADSTTLDVGTETLLTGATVTAVPSTGGATITLSAVSGSDGQYRTPDIHPDEYNVTISAPNHDTRTVIREPEAGLASTGNGAVVELLKHPTMTVEVFSDDDFTSGNTADDAPINDDAGSSTDGATVTATLSSGSGATLTLTAPDDTNDYSVSNVPPGTYTVSVTAADHATRTITNVVVDAAVAESVSTFLLKNPPLVVMITDNVNTPIDGATVRATLAGNTVQLTGVGGATGRYNATALAPGTHSITASKDGFGQGSTTFAITAGTLPTFDATAPSNGTANLVLQLEQDATIQVNVTDGTGGATLNDVEVTLRVVDDSTFATRHRFTGELAGTDDDGRVTFTGLSAARGYQLRMTRVGYDVKVVDVGDITDELNDSFVPGETEVVNVTLTRLSALIVNLQSNPGATALAGGTVVATPDGASTGGGVTLAPTGATGVYLAPALPYGGAWTISGSAPGHSSNTSALTVTVGTNATVTLGLSRYPTVAVQINDDDGAPITAITDATVTLTPTAGPAVIVAHAGTGSYTRALTDPGTYTLTVSKTGWATSTQSITATAGVTFSTVTVGLQPLRDLTVTVFSDVITVGATELGGVTGVLSDANGNVIRTESTDDDGDLVLADLAPGVSYSLELSKDRWVTKSQSVSVTNADGGLVQVFLVSFPDLIVNVHSDDGTPAALAGATVVATPTTGGGPAIPLLPTTTVGQYIAANVLPDVYTVTASAPAHVSFTTGNQTVSLAGGNLTVATIELDAYPTLQVTVLSNDLTTGTTADDDPLTTAAVTAVPSGGGAAVSFAHTANGVYEAVGVAPATTYAVTITDAGHASGTGSVVGTVGGVRTTSVTLLELPLVTVQVNDDDGAPITGITDATVTITPTAGGTALTLTHQATGSYTRASVPAGSYTLSVSKSGWVTHIETVTVTAGTAFSAVTVALRIQRSVTIEVFADVITNPGTEVTGAVVELLNSSGVAIESRTTTGTGQAVFTGLTPGTLYTFRISATGYVTETFSLTPVTTADTTRDEAITSYPDLTVTVRSADGSTAAFGGATVLATPSDGGPSVPVLPTSTVGTYRAENIEPGDDYVVTASAPLHDSVSVTDVDIVLGTDEAVGPIDLPAYPTLEVTVLSNDLTTGTTADDDAVTTATVTATPSDGGPAVALGHTSGGVYQAVGVLPSTTYAVTITDTGHASGSGSVSGLAGGVRTTSVTLLEMPTLTVQVNTDDGSVAGTTGATVTLAPTDGGAALTIPHVGTPNGKHLRASIPAGAYTLSAALSGHRSASTAVTVTAGTAITGDPFTLELDKLGSFQVTVFDETVNAGVTNLTGATVDLRVPADPTFAVRTITTSATGIALFSELTPGLTYEATVSKAGFDTTTVSEAIGAGEVFTNQTALQRASTLTVNLFTENDGDGATDGTLSGATVTATLAGGSALSVPQVAPGVYRLSPLPAGSYTVNASATDHSAGSATPTVGTGDDEVVNLTLNAHPVLSLTVRSSVTINSIASFSTLTNATVKATLIVSPFTEYTFDHQGEGVYTRAIPIDGTYDISVSAPGHTTIAVAHNDIATVIGDAAPSLSGTDLAAVTGSVSGVIDVLATTDEGVVVTASLNGATVAASPATTIADGVWSISGLAPGTWQITFTRDLYSPLTVPVLIARGSAVNTGSTLTGVNRSLAPLGTSIIGQVSSVASGQLAVSGTNPSTPLSGVTVSLSPGAGGDTRGDQTAVDDGNGHFYFTFADLAPATYTLTFSKADHNDLVLPVTVTAGQIVELTPTLTQTPRQVNFAATEGGGLNGVVFRLTNSSLLSSPGYVEATTAGGVASISIANVPPGTYTLAVTAPTGHSITSTPPSTVTVTTANVTVADQTFQATSSVTGIVLLNNDSAAGSVGDDGFPSPGATVTVSKGTFSVSATSTVGTGAFTVTNVPQDSGYTITVAATGYASKTLTSQTVGAGALNVGNVTIDQLSSIAVSVIDEDGDTISALTIGIYDADGTTRTVNYLGATTTDGSGTSTTFSNLTPGETVFVRATAASKSQVLEVTRTLEAGANFGAEGLVVELLSSATLDVTVAGLVATESVTLTFEWEAPTGMATSTSRLFSVDGATLTQSVTVPPRTPVYVIRPDVGAKNGSVTTPVTGSPITTAPVATTAVTVTYA